jgi:hypothetical protein
MLAKIQNTKIYNNNGTLSKSELVVSWPLLKMLFNKPINRILKSTTDPIKTKSDNHRILI